MVSFEKTFKIYSNVMFILIEEHEFDLELMVDDFVTFFVAGINDRI